MTQLKKSLTPIGGAALMLNIVIGAGLLALPGLTVKIAGDMAIYVWIICIIVSLPMLGVFIIMGRRHPNIGGVSHFAKIAFGFHAYTISSFLFLGAVFLGLPAIALTGGYYLSAIIPLSPVILAMGLVLATGTINFLSASIASRFSTLLASLLVVALFFIIIIGLFSISWSEMDARIAPPSRISLDEISQPLLLVFFAFTGWEVAAGIAEEFKTPKKDFPKAMYLSFFMICIIYLTIAFVVQASGLSNTYEASFVSIVTSKFGISGGVLTALVASVIIFANLLGAIWAVSRLVLSLGRERIITAPLRINNNGTPASSVSFVVVILIFVLTLAWSQWINLEKMLVLAGQNFLILYGVAALSLFKTSNMPQEKMIAILTIAIVVAVMWWSSSSIYYPTLLIVLGYAVGSIRNWQIASNKKRGRRGR